MTTLIHFSYLGRIDSSQSASSVKSQNAKVALLIPSAYVSMLMVDVSQVPKRYIQQALPSLIEDDLAEELEKVQLCPGPVINNQLPVLVVSKAKLREWLDAARVHGIEPCAIYPDFYLLPWIENQITVSQVENSYQIARFSEHRGLSGSEDKIRSVVELMKSDSSRVVDSSIKLSSAERSLAGDTTPISLLAGEFATADSSTGWGKEVIGFAAGIAALLMALSVNLYAWGHRYSAENEQLTDQIEHTYGEAIQGADESTLNYNRRMLERAIDNAGNDMTGMKSHIHAASSIMQRCGGCYLEEFSADVSGFALSYRKTGSDRDVELTDAPVGYALKDSKNDRDLIMAEYYLKAGL